MQVVHLQTTRTCDIKLQSTNESIKYGEGIRAFCSMAWYGTIGAERKKCYIITEVKPSTLLRRSTQFKIVYVLTSGVRSSAKRLVCNWTVWEPWSQSLHSRNTCWECWAASSRGNKFALCPTSFFISSYLTKKMDVVKWFLIPADFVIAGLHRAYTKILSLWDGQSSEGLHRNVRMVTRNLPGQCPVNKRGSTDTRCMCTALKAEWTASQQSFSPSLWHSYRTWTLPVAVFFLHSFVRFTHLHYAMYTIPTRSSSHS